ncbi:hypothetical protein BJP25_17350 [Actinokineospora bangkokensis]|uniref:Uncharacterized protein n=1 Tax=Actinokineospora bangkokensis TaxID=1193682 RepID=A0A1Q9LMK8_9PSEU|nr:hypothetical protein BJP25_17350 [Actinokineospora bangkokensis]
MDGARVVIQPSFGNRHARRHWADTLDTCVDFHAPRLAGALTEQQRAALDEQHPAGSAWFWGASDKHDKRADLLTAGDVVLLTGQKHVLAIGEVGHCFRNHEFARRLWRPDPTRCLWSNVYSFRALRHTRIPYEQVWALPGFNPGDNFMGLRLLSPDKAAAVLAGLDVRRRLRER